MREGSSFAAVLVIGPVNWQQVLVQVLNDPNAPAEGEGEGSAEGEGEGISEGEGEGEGSVEGETEGETVPTLEELNEICAGVSEENAEEDQDGDGLSLCVETLLGSSDESVDTDEDGMGDYYEALHQLNLLVDDGQEDPDDDGLTNLEEALQDSDPRNPDDPNRVVFVAPSGEDVPEAGGASRPCATIAYALGQATGAEEAPVRILLAAGEYAGGFTLNPWTIVASQVDGEEAVILGSVVGANDSALEYVTLRGTGPEEFLLDMNDVSMRAIGVLFEPAEGQTLTGILVDGDRPAESLIEHCRFDALRIGIDVGRDLPLIRRCLFILPGYAGIVIRNSDLESLSNTLGDVHSPDTGWNTFQVEAEGAYAVVNFRTDTLIMQMNDWSTDDPEEIEALIAGGGAFDPPLEKGLGILAAALYCRVWDAATQTPVLNASITLEPSAYDAVTENSNGIYAFPAIGEGSYTLTVTTEDYPPVTRNALVQGGGVTSLNIALGSGGGGKCGCNEDDAKKRLPTPPEAFLGALTVLILAGWSRRPRRKE